jgi:hypothetical protein
MALPKISSPIFELKLPLSKKIIRYRPFLVKEEKILLMAIEANDEPTIINSIKQIVSNCCLDKVDVDKIPILDLEFLFLNLRAKSVGEVVELHYKCNNNVTDETGNTKKCNHVNPITINLYDIKPEISNDDINKIDLGNDIGIVMTYPNFHMVSGAFSGSQIEIMMSIIVKCIDYIYDKDDIYYAKDTPKQELEDFIESLSREQFAKIQHFFDSIPRLKKTVEFKCNKCGYVEEIVVEGLQSFFG